MRIARIIEYFPPHLGGMERHGLVLSREQVKLGHGVDVFIGYGDSKSDFKDASKSDFRIYKAPLQFLPLYSKTRRIWFNFWAAQKVKKQHNKNPYSIIHLHGDFVEAYFGGELSKKLGIPAIITIHAGLNKNLLKPKNARYFENIVKIICVSNEIAEDLKNIGISESKLAVISSGIYLDDFNNFDKNKIFAPRNQYSKPIIISVGVLRINKGFKYLVEAFRLVKSKINTATLLIIGDGPDKSELRARAKNINSVYFLGRQNYAKVIEYLKSADIFVLASIDAANDREGMPTSIMEAMAAGLPVVATKVGGIPSLIKENINGLLVDTESPEKLEEAIVKIINNHDLTRKMSVRNLEDIKQKDWPLVAKKITEIYRQCFR